MKYEDEPAFRQPALVLHGRKDEVVPAALSKAFAEGHPNVTLRLVDSGHELTDVLETAMDGNGRVSWIPKFVEIALCDRLKMDWAT